MSATSTYKLQTLSSPYCNVIDSPLRDKKDKRKCFGLVMANEVIEAGGDTIMLGATSSYLYSEGHKSLTSVVLSAE